MEEIKTIYIPGHLIYTDWLPLRFRWAYALAIIGVFDALFLAMLAFVPFMFSLLVP